MERTTKGKHVLLDFIGWLENQEFNADDLLSLMRFAAESSGVRIVHEKMVYFDGSVSPEGFASVLLIDESHITAHCYSEQGLLAMDIFTCGEHDPEVIADTLISHLKSKVPDLECVSRETRSRFLNGV